LSFQNPGGGRDPFGDAVEEFILSHEQLFDQLSAAANARLFRDEAAQKPKPFRYR
jgi:hypothetical protein